MFLGDVYVATWFSVFMLRQQPDFKYIECKCRPIPSPNKSLSLAGDSVKQSRSLKSNHFIKECPHGWKMLRSQHADGSKVKQMGLVRAAVS